MSRMRAFGDRFSALASRWMPDPFVLVLLLSLVVCVVALVMGRNLEGMAFSERVSHLATGWFDSLYKVGLMRFAMQMCIVLVTGHALALAPPVQRAIGVVCRRAKSARAAVVIVVLASCFASLLQWGLGVIVGALMAREMGKYLKREGIVVHYPLLGAAGYAGFLVWHGGLSGSAPLKVAEKGHFLEEAIGVIPVTETIFSMMNVSITLSMIVVLVGACWWMMPRDESQMVEFPDEPERDVRDEEVHSSRGGVVQWLERGRVFSKGVALLLCAWCVWWFGKKGLAGMNLNTINLTFLASGLLLHRSARDYVDAVGEGVRGCAGVILQFPFYFGVLGLLTSSGLITQLSEWMVSMSGPGSFGVMTFLAAGFVNLMVPSGGGQWAVQGPLMVEGARQLGLEMPQVILAMSYGDAWTNLLQPFWALPLLGIMRLEARDIIGYTALLMCLTGPVIMAWLYVWA